MTAAADLLVVGAGPAGSAAAITAARAGLDVLLVDQARFPRDKCCGDGLTTGALRRLEELGLDPDGLRSWQPVRTAQVRIPDGRVAALTLPDPQTTYAASIQRMELDAALVDLARAAGAKVVEGVGVTGARAVEGGRALEADLDDGSRVRAWFAVGADGMWSTLRKSVGAGDPGYLGEWHAVRQYFSDAPTASRDLWVWFEDDLRPGYAWSFPLPHGRVNAGFGVRRRPGESTGRMKQQWAELLRRPHLAAVLGDARPEGPLRAWPIPARVSAGRQSALGGRVLFAGDAARAADCMTGEGIAQALETGDLAAQVIAAAGPEGATSAASDYNATLRRGMAIDDRVSAMLSRVLESERGANAWFDVANHSEASRRRFARWMFEDYPRAALATPWRWKRGMFSRPGAFRRS